MSKLSVEQKATYKTLARQIDEAYAKLFDHGTGGRISTNKPNLYNNRLERMKDFMKNTGLDFSNNRYWNAKPITE